MNYSQGDNCPICGTGTLENKLVTETFEYKGQTFEVPNYSVWECCQCHESFVSSKESKSTGRLIRDFHRKVDGLLSASEIKEIRLRLGYNQDALSDLLGGGAKSFNRYENSEVIQSQIMDNLLRALDASHAALEAIVNKNKPKATRTMSTTMVYQTKVEGHMLVNYDK